MSKVAVALVAVPAALALWPLARAMFRPANIPSVQEEAEAIALAGSERPLSNDQHGEYWDMLDAVDITTNPANPLHDSTANPLRGSQDP